MKDLEVGFCADCTSGIISKRLALFWKCACISSLTDKTWIAFLASDNLSQKYIRALEAKNYIVSTDHGDHVLIKPEGLLKKDDDSYLVCLCPEEHLDTREEEDRERAD